MSETNRGGRRGFLKSIYKAKPREYHRDADSAQDAGVTRDKGNGGVVRC